MSNPYSVDEILAEVRRKKEASDAELSRLTARRAGTEPSRPPHEADGPDALPFFAPPSRKAPAGAGSPYEPPRTVREEDAFWEEDRFSPEPPAPRAPFSLSGMTEAPDRPSPRAAAGREDTRMDLPVRRPTAAPPPDAGATRVMPALRPQDDPFEQRRQEKVREFMQSSFSLDEDDDESPRPPADEDEDEDGPDDALGSLSQFFGGLSRSGIGTGRGGKKNALLHDDEPAPPARAARRRAPEIEEEDDEPEGEFSAPRDRLGVAEEILASRRGLAIRILVSAVCFLVLLYVSLCNLYPLPLWHPFTPENFPRNFVVLNLVVLLLSALVSNSVVGGGLIGLVTLKANADTPAALAVLACVAHGVALVVKTGPESADIAANYLGTGDGFFYFSVAALALLMNAVGKYAQVARIARNFELLSRDAERVCEALAADDPLADALCEGQGLEQPAVCCPVKAGFSTHFIRNSYADDYSAGMGRLSAPLFLVFAMLISVGAWMFFEQGPMDALTIFCAVLCIASPASATLVGNLPLLRASGKLAKDGAVIPGYETIERFEEMNAVALDAGDLYPAGKVVLHGIKAFAQSRVDEAILDAASVMCSVDGLLKEIFFNIIGGKTAILKPVDSLAYEDGAGLCASVGGKPVLIGNRELMRAHGISTPSHDYESKFVKGDREILYLANSGEVTAMFVLSYQTSEDVADWLALLSRQEMSLIVRSTDPNITPARIAADYDYPEEFIRVIPAELLERYARFTAPVARCRGDLVSLRGGAPRLRALAAVQTLRNAIMTGTVLQLTGLILGYALIAFLALTGTIAR
ncbi:MAG: hypothetical protein RR197_01635, partial [Oscillospiraceae bacterium]